MSEVIDGSFCTDLYMDGMGRSWHMIQRAGGSISLYYTLPGVGAHLVVYDTLDMQPPSTQARDILARLTELHTAIGALLASA